MTVRGGLPLEGLAIILTCIPTGKPDVSANVDVDGISVKVIVGVKVSVGMKVNAGVKVGSSVRKIVSVGGKLGVTVEIAMFDIILG